MSEARKTFSVLSKGILNLIRSADLYQVHLLAKRAGEEPDKTLVKSIMGGNKISGLNFSSCFYKREDLDFLETSGQMKEIGQQILLATHTALELYLVDKFKEYYRYKTKGCDENIINESIKGFSFRSLDDIRKTYSKTLDIHLPSFDIEFFTDEKSTFQPKTSWEALILISRARNEIAHTGQTITLKINCLLDIWHPFEFARRWVEQFDPSADRYIYQGSDKWLKNHYLSN